jgi:spore coat protein U-like protein
MIRRALLAATLVLLAAQADAQTTTGLRACSVSTTPLAFGTFSGSRIDAGGTVSVTCNGNGNNNPAAISLSEGSSNTFLDRVMLFGNNELHYNLYVDGSYSTIWGNGLGETQLKIELFDFRQIGAVTQSATIFGRIPFQALPAAGSYADTIIVTVAF